MVVVGAAVAGLKAACRARRLLPDAAITVVDPRAHISLPPWGLPLYLAGEAPSLAALRSTTYGCLRDVAYFRDVKRVDVRTGWLATAIDRDARRLAVRHVADGATDHLAYDRLVLATGAATALPAGVALDAAALAGHDPLAIQSLQADLAGGRVESVAVLGGGCVGTVMAAALAEVWGVSTTLVEAADQVLPRLLDPELGAIAARVLGDLGVSVRTERVGAVHPSVGRGRARGHGDRGDRG